MPLPLAHPAAVLPLRRFCPKYLSFSTLIIGSLVPDVAYAFNSRRFFSEMVTMVFGQPGMAWLGEQGIRNWDGLSHSLLGSVVFCLPVGFMVSVAFRSARTALVATLPNPHRDLLSVLCHQPKHTVRTYVASLLIGVWLHLAWDSLTKEHWWLAKTWPVLQMEVVEVGSSRIELAQVFWGLSSVGGTAALAFAYLAYLKRNRVSVRSHTRQDASAYALWLSVVFLSALIALVLTQRFAQLDFTARRLFRFFHAYCEVYFTVFGAFVGGIVLVSLVRRYLRPNKSME